MLSENTINDLLAEKTDLETRIEAINVLLDGRSSSKAKSSDQIAAEMLMNGFSTTYTPNVPKIHKIKYQDNSKNKTIGHFPKKTKKSGGWSTKYDRCLECQGDEKKYRANGLCVECYNKAQRGLKPKGIKKTYVKPSLRAAPIKAKRPDMVTVEEGIGGSGHFELKHYKYKCLECDSSVVSTESDYTKVQCEDCHGPVVQL